MTTLFTGLVQQVGTVVDAASSRLRIVVTDIDTTPGASIAVNGCCLTVVEADGDVVAFDVMPETLAHTNLGSLAAGDTVNLEGAMRLGDPLGGHWVQGHVDDVGTVAATRPDGNALVVEIDLPPRLSRLCVERGSITIDGVSLTVMAVLEHGVRLSLIPETRTRTTLGALAPGRRVNVEADVLARYVDRLLAPHAQRT